VQTDGIAPGKAPQRAVFVVVFEAVAGGLKIPLPFPVELTILGVH
jgi:hypothetical protein